MFISRKGGMTYVPRYGQAGWDWTVGNFTRDGVLRTLDISGVVPASVKLVHLKSIVRNSGTGQTFFGVTGSDETTNQTLQGTYPVAQNKDYMFTAVIPNNGDGLLKYYAQDTNLSVINLTVIGWWA